MVNPERIAEIIWPAVDWVPVVTICIVFRFTFRVTGGICLVFRCWQENSQEMFVHRLHFDCSHIGNVLRFVGSGGIWEIDLYDLYREVFRRFAFTLSPPVRLLPGFTGSRSACRLAMGDKT